MFEGFLQQPQTFAHAITLRADAMWPKSSLYIGDSARSSRNVTMMRIGFDDVEFDVIDEGAGPPIVLLAEFGLAKESWDAQAAGLAGTARVVRFDLRGMGRSSAPPGPYLMEQLASDVAGICDALGVERAVLAGHGLGGFVTLAFFRMFAERCAGLALIATRGGADEAPAADARLRLADRVELEGTAPLAAAEPDERARECLLQTNRLGAAAMLRGIAMRATSEDLYDEIDLPVRVVAGVDDPDAAASRDIANGISSARLDLLDCGRLPIWTAPDAVTASLEELLRASAQSFPRRSSV
jgi:3-oxoadipate enol-lactonase